MILSTALLCLVSFILGVLVGALVTWRVVVSELYS
jgi:ABC-type cobalamin transport system permease subunit